MNLDEMIVGIIEGVEKRLNGNYGNGVTFPDKTKECIHKAADMCRQTGVYINTKNDASERLKTGKASDLYMEMLAKMANAPTFIHAACTPRLMLPLISDAIKREEQDGSAGTDIPV